MNGLSGPKGNNFDESYVTASMPHNTPLAAGTFVKQAGDWQVTRLAIMHGFYSGAVYGGGLGLGLAIYHRQMRFIPKTALLVGAPYAAFLGISTVYRMDI